MTNPLRANYLLYLKKNFKVRFPLEFEEVPNSILLVGLVGRYKPLKRLAFFELEEPLASIKFFRL